MGRGSSKPSMAVKIAICFETIFPWMSTLLTSYSSCVSRSFPTQFRMLNKLSL
ncbi:hypothetical protein JG687_00006780 [Phytophthora cactorum]|uniref:Uncharacterized protein n=1 Tax=Phytophthora cactorum TaxID=29920 RepID=A0A8T1UK57_9STRA|nr:hypothetical protein JG687_00006780 [Phytophthora cactorum]